MKKFWYWLIILVAFVSIIITFGLVKEELATGETCILVLGIPACYIVLASMMIALITHLINSSAANWVYFITMAIVSSVAVYGSVGDIIGIHNCPTWYGIGMCFMSLTACLTLLISKIFHLKS